MLKTALTTITLATVLFTTSISANSDVTTNKLAGSTIEVERIGAFDNMPVENLNTTELQEVGEGIVKVIIKYRKNGTIRKIIYVYN